MPLPANTSIIIPRLVCRDAAAEIEFCVRAFDATELNRRPGPDGAVAERTRMILAPRIEGVVPVRSSAVQFAAALRARVEAGLLLGRPSARSNYQVTEERLDLLCVRAADYWTAINVGLNDMQLTLPSSGSVHFDVRYWRWASYVLGLSGVLGAIGVVLLLAFDVRGYIGSRATARLPRLSVDQNVLVAWAFVLFWGFVWPWLLIALHKRPLRRLVERIVREVDAQAGSG